MELCLLKQKMITMEKILDRSVTTRELVFGAALIACLTPWVSPPVALLLELVIALFVCHPFLHLNHKAPNILSQFSLLEVSFRMKSACPLKQGREVHLFLDYRLPGLRH